MLRTGEPFRIRHSSSAFHLLPQKFRHGGGQALVQLRGDLAVFLQEHHHAAQMCDSIRRNTGCITAVSDRDSIIAQAGGIKRDLMDKPNSAELEQLMEDRKLYCYSPGGNKLKPTDHSERYHLGVAAPILCQGDILGCVMMLLEEESESLGESDQRLASTVAEFLGKQMES